VLLLHQLNSQASLVSEGKHKLNGHFFSIWVRLLPVFYNLHAFLLLCGVHLSGISLYLLGYDVLPGEIPSVVLSKSIYRFNLIVGFINQLGGAIGIEVLKNLFIYRTFQLEINLVLS
jgi:hypothetical protein